MSNTRRARPRRLSRFHDAFDDEIAVLCGWADIDHVEEAKRQTHDGLIAMLGDRRRGGVSWRIIDNVAGALDLITKMREGADESHLEQYDQLESLLTQHGGVLVVATAPGRRAP